MSRAEDMKRAVEWLGTWIGELNELDPYWQRRIEGLADDFAAIRAETFEAVIEACGNASHGAEAIRTLAKESAK